MQNYIGQKKELQNFIIEFLEDTENTDIDVQNLLVFLNNQEIMKTRNELELFLRFVLNISDHHRNRNFIQKINKIVILFNESIKATLTNLDIFNIFKSNKLILLFLIENKIFSFDKIILNNFSSYDIKERQYFYYFYPEIKTIINKDTKEIIKSELLQLNSTIFNNFDENRQIGENDSYICSLIREDAVEEFIAYVNRHNLNITMAIPYSIFETNKFLIDKESTTLIEYSAFFGSIQTFQYLLFNNVELTPSLWLYAIHSQNAELIHLLEENKVEPPENSYEFCLYEAIKCHHNAIANYIKLNLIDQNIEKSKKIEFIEKVFDCSFRYSNFTYFPNEIKFNFLFFYLCMYNYSTLVNMFLNMKKDQIESTIQGKILFKKFF